ncbi:Putative cryptic C4-dicarboxylate transporter DcuD [Paenibacillus konkukensis]|uniref:Cryptic C4-dicarboxylate transporter DcuD n=1 Tax=Paenibacillus konkukensis TaxID=2020716 RepID=A0ABY4RLF5_9BACL|nr:C4-dicarboxylate transporter DcuC [Paenibacillus konkukensis]UQZ82877.1 Putative cryptic C4-dicarboxylate transporter DcuD [Paenibacillus konkukensis]
MSNLVMYASAIIAVLIVIVMLIKKMDIKITLFLMGSILILLSIFMGQKIDLKDFATTGSVWLDPLQVIVVQFKQTLSAAGFIVLLLGGYTAYMSSIGANEVTVSVLSKPIAKIKSVYVLVPVVFLIGNLLSLVIPSASNLAIILLATLFPILRKAGMSALTAGAVIATSATIVPTPLGSDNVAIAQELAKHAAFANISVSDYVFKYHAVVSIPTLLLIAIVHFLWQKRMDKKDNRQAQAGQEPEVIETGKETVVSGGALYKTVYAILPVFPIILLLGSYAVQMTTGKSINISVEVATLVSLVFAIVCELIRHRSGKSVLEKTESFFKGMGGAIPIVALLVAASVFVTGLKSIGLVGELQDSMQRIQGNGLDFILPLILVALTALIVILSGSGTALIFAMVPLIVPLAEAAGISPIAISVPLGLSGNLFRAVSPVAAVTLIVAGTIKVDPIAIVKRTSVPMIVGVIFMFLLSMIVFL